MEYHLGDKVLYDEEEYVVFWIYESGFIEITSDILNNCKLVHYSEVIVVRE
ncbi:hypothetical protein KH172YL63_18200 [Bacillus sp. KH172YL63]|nr:hypothetical protein KH172YL63_18200 [Bacillus sp. KH172YL63]